MPLGPFPRHGVPRWRDARRPAQEGTPALAGRAAPRDRDRRRPGQSAQAGRRTPGRQAGKHHAHDYASNESGRYEVYVQSFPPAGGKRQVSNRGGVLPRWRRDGKELFYVGLDQKMMAVDISATSRFESGVPRELFEVRGLDAFNYSSPYAVAADGQRFLVIVRAPQARASPISVVLNWTAGLTR